MPTLLKSIKLAGFKSFVDPTTFHLQTSLTAIVGPNGCGKSNIVDAVRWVIGEISAKQLRGESMTDVIFNGTSERKPVGQASIELVFDNKEGMVGGQYAGYNEICVRREITRDVQSSYYLNGTKVRRKDILSAFMGTGLGSRSYSIIEQGMISRLIEAKPEEMRAYLEEVAGISKYKERRRETENRMRHTRENLSRLSDLREEIAHQLDKLERQAKAAEQYKLLKDEEHLLRGQLQVLYYQDNKQQIDHQEKIIRETETRLDAKIAEQHGIDKHIETLRQEVTYQTDSLNEVQKRFYSLGADIARLEQQISNRQSRQHQLEMDLTEIQQTWQEALQQQTDDQAQLAEIVQAIGELEPSLEIAAQEAETSRQQMLSAEQAIQSWQQRWDEFNQNASEVKQQVEVERTRIAHLRQRLQHEEQRLARVKEELSQIDIENISQELVKLADQQRSLQAALQRQQNQLDEQLQQIIAQRDHNVQLEHQLEALKSQYQDKQTKKTMLEALQEAALGKTDVALNQWLQEHGLADKPRLAEQFEVEVGWEQAVEAVLQPYLKAICVEDLHHNMDSLEKLSVGHIMLITRYSSSKTSSNAMPTLASKVNSRWPLTGLLDHVYITDTLIEAKQLVSHLAPHEMIVTRSGTCLGPAWIRINKIQDEKDSVIKRRQKIASLDSQIFAMAQEIAKRQEELEAGKQLVLNLEQERDQIQKDLQITITEHSTIQGHLTAMQSRLEQLQQRRTNLQQEQYEIEERQRQDHQTLAQATQLEASALTQTQIHAQQRQDLLNGRAHCQETLKQTRMKSHADKENADQIKVKLSASQSQRHYLEQNLERVEKQLANLNERKEALVNAKLTNSAPLSQLQEQLEALLQKRLDVENELQVARQKSQALEHNLRDEETQRSNKNEEAALIRSELEQIRMQWQGLKVRMSTHQEQISEMGFELETLIQALPQEAGLEQWTEKLASIERKIQRLGAINLAAIDELEQLRERKIYLDKQDDDLMEALNTLEDAIRKIDRETKDRFKETYEKINKYFGELFPKIFGGGKAELELTEQDLLNAGVIVRAQPAGKRNTTIHMLSGGEKALTAIALVFALFQLNPSPFCILDEVDAPLDDVNVGRFCALVKEMSKTVQFIVITHNKVTMEMAKQLAGITMNEPGVSRLVSVDIDEAIKMAEEKSSMKEE